MTKKFDPFKSIGGVGKSIGQELAGGVVHAFGGGKRAESAARNIGGSIGEVALPAAGVALGFKNGGKVPGVTGQPVKAIVHSGEYVLPVGVKPTAAQKKAVAKRKADEKKKK
jgi:hypothetical protein